MFYEFEVVIKILIALTLPHTLSYFTHSHPHTLSYFTHSHPHILAHSHPHLLTYFTHSRFHHTSFIHTLTLPLHTLTHTSSQSLLWFEDRRLVLSSDEVPLLLAQQGRLAAMKTAPKFYLFTDAFCILQVRKHTSVLFSK